MVGAFPDLALERARYSLKKVTLVLARNDQPTSSATCVTPHPFAMDFICNRDIHPKLPNSAIMRQIQPPPFDGGEPYRTPEPKLCDLTCATSENLRLS